MNKKFKAKLKSAATAVVTALGIIFTPLNAEAAFESSAEDSFHQQPQIENVVSIDNGNNVIFASITADTTSADELLNDDIRLAKDQIEDAFADYHCRVGDEALQLKPIADKVAALLQDVIVESVMVTGNPEDEYLNIRLHMPGQTIISMTVDTDATLVPVNIYYHKQLMASDVAELDDIHSMLIAVQNRNV